MRNTPRKRRPRPQLGQRQCAARRMICDSGGRVTIFGAVVQASRSAAEPRSNSTSAAKQVAEICVSGPSGVKTPEENAAFMSCLSFLRQDKKARPTKLKTFSATCEACATYLRGTYAVSACNGTGKGPHLNSCEKFPLVLQASCTNVVRSTS